MDGNNQQWPAKAFKAYRPNAMNAKANPKEDVGGLALQLGGGGEISGRTGGLFLCTAEGALAAETEVAPKAEATALAASKATVEATVGATAAEAVSFAAEVADLDRTPTSHWPYYMCSSCSPAPDPVQTCCLRP